MMKEMICIVCPKGCRLTVDPEKETVTGNACQRGEKYALEEIRNPTRTLTTTVSIEGALHPRLPVKTSKPIPKEKMQKAMEIAGKIKIQAPVKLGDVIAENILDTGADLIASRNMELER